MDTAQKERVSVAVSKDTHNTLASIARILGVDIRDAVDEACRLWNKQKSALARKRAAEVLQSVA